MDKVLKQSEITEFYQCKSIFMTGGSGFFGKVLIEKLLRSCKDLKTLYILVRSKNGKTAEERFQDIFKSKIFDRLREEQFDFSSQVVCIPGDLKSYQLGISSSDYQLLINQISIIFHVGATVKFNESLKLTLQNNVLSTKSVIDLAKGVQNLQALIYVSTAYANTHQKVILEKVYPTEFPVKSIVDCVEWMDDKMLESLQDQLLSRHPNNYCYSKCLAEQLLAEEGQNLPLAIVRPSFATPSIAEPLPGWVDLFSGPVSLTVAYGLGLIRTLHLSLSTSFDLIPVDYCVNMILASAWYIDNQRFHSPVVFHCATSALNPAESQQIHKLSISLVKKYPLSKALRYPRLLLTHNRLVYSISKYLLHYGPAVLVDGARLIVGKKPALVTLYQKVHRKLDIMKYFMENNWKFEMDNYKKLLESLAEEDKKIFCFDVQKIDWVEYTEICAKGGRQYLMNEPLTNLPLARKHFQRLYCIDLTINAVLIGAVLYFLPTALWNTLSDVLTGILNWIF